MLKELWRKLEAEFLHPYSAEPRPGDDALSPRASVSRRLRLLPHITHTGEFHLERLTALLRARYGQSFSVPDDSAANDQSLKEVIRFAARIQDQDVQRELLLFYLNCSPVIQEYLRAETPLGHGPFFGS
ncbi:MAG TPA: hypothetical protein VKY53_02825 [Marinobacter sp.]|nr:hypothetical protein [Marinobacter sp.]